MNCAAVRDGRRLVPDISHSRQKKTQPARPVSVEPPEQEPKATPDPAEDELFLTPRVVDHNVFTRYAETLRGILREAGSRVRDVGERSGELERLLESAGSKNAELKPRIETSARLIATLDQRAERMQHLLDATENADTQRERLEAALADATDALIERATRKAEDALSGIQHRLERAEASVERAEARLVDALARAEEAEQRAGAAEARLRAIDERASAIDQTVAHATNEIENVEARAATISQDSTATLEDIERRTRAAIETAGKAPETALAHLDRRLREIESRAGAVDATITPLRDLCDRAEALSASLTDPETAGPLDDALERMGTASEQAERGLEELRSLTEQSEEARGILADALLEAVDHIDRLDQQRAELVERIDAEIQRAQSHRPTAETALADLETRASEIEGRRDAIAGDLNEHIARVEQAGAWLAEMIQRAEAAGGVPAAGTPRTFRRADSSTFDDPRAS